MSKTNNYYKITVAGISVLALSALLITPLKVHAEPGSGKTEVTVSPTTKSSIRPSATKSPELTPKTERESEDDHSGSNSGSGKTGEIRSTKSEDDMTKEEDNHGSRNPKVPKNLMVKCEKVTKRVDEITGKYKENHVVNIKNYQQLISKIESLTAKAKTVGYDTSALETDLASLKEAVSKLNTTRSMNIAALNKTLDIQCGVEKAVFKQAFNEAKKNEAELKAQYKQVQELWKKVKSDLVLLKQQIKPSGTPKPTEIEQEMSVTPTITMSPTQIN